MDGMRLAISLLGFFYLRRSSSFAIRQGEFYNPLGCVVAVVAKKMLDDSYLIFVSFSQTDLLLLLFG